MSDRRTCWDWFTRSNTHQETCWDYMMPRDCLYMTATLGLVIGACLWGAGPTDSNTQNAGFATFISSALLFTLTCLCTGKRPARYIPNDKPLRDRTDLGSESDDETPRPSVVPSATL